MDYLKISTETPSITDWIQAIGVILASVGLFINFFYQRRALREQAMVRFLEEERDRRAIMPYLEMEQTFDETTGYYNLIFKCIEHAGNFLLIMPFLPEMNQYNIVVSGFKEGDEYKLAIPKEVIDSYSGALSKDRRFFKVSYMDRESRPYEQYVYLVGYQIYIGDPIQYLHIRLMENMESSKSRRLLKFLKQKISKS